MSEDTQSVTLLRHGETEWSVAGRHTGRSDIPLTDAGREQARRVAPVLARVRFAAVLVSPLERARATATLAGLPDTALRDDLMEWDYGEYDGVTTMEIQRTRPGWNLWDDGTPGGETLAEVAARVDRVIAEVRSQDGDVALVAHGHVLRVLAARWVGLHPSCGRALRLDTATLSILGYEHTWPVIRSWNVTLG